MRTSIVPAQITTVEDKIVGNVSVQQAALLGIPLLFGFVVVILFPPSGRFVPYKVAIVAAMFILCGLLAARIRGRIVVKWLILFAIYCSRPKYYVYDKNTLYLRDEIQIETEEAKSLVDIPETKKIRFKTPTINPHEFARLEQLALDARSRMKFEVGKKGELNVRITEVK